jgi:hypothetical protein
VWRSTKVEAAQRSPRPNVALQPTCGASLRRGGELRRRRMRLNFGVRPYPLVGGAPGD